jgi:hypothetical protein
VARGREEVKVAPDEEADEAAAKGHGAPIEAGACLPF